MSVQVECPNCSALIDASPDMLGAPGMCTHCGMTVTFRKPTRPPLAPMTPSCPSCRAEMRPGAVVCVECGLNTRSGVRLRQTNVQLSLKKKEKELAPGIMSATAKCAVAMLVVPVCYLFVRLLAGLGRGSAPAATTSDFASALRLLIHIGFPIAGLAVTYSAITDVQNGIRALRTDPIRFGGQVAAALTRCWSLLLLISYVAWFTWAVLRLIRSG